MSDADPREFRNALGQFATGVTVVTTTNEAGEPVGVTASSFNSVSLDPPLVLWSLAKTSNSMPAYQSSGGFNVHILASHQDSLSNTFARPSENNFADVNWKPCDSGHPVLPEYATLFRCETQYQYEGGDHVIFVGKVVEFETHNYPVLVFHGGKYADAKVKPKKPEINLPSVDVESGQYTEEFLLYLVSRAHFQSSYPIRKACYDVGMSEPEYFCLSLLSMNGSLSRDEIVSRLEHTGHHPDEEIFARLVRKNWVTDDTKAISISDIGREKFIQLLAQSKAMEEQLTKYFTDDEIDGAKAFLKKLITITGQDIPELW
ncbi:flavin reductase [Fretibacter rubidus]|uniref:flavin reductase n=1 Tax=Fretibacter rubidus TaxID=570162 RepID=UPI00352B3A12